MVTPPVRQYAIDLDAPPEAWAELFEAIARSRETFRQRPPLRVATMQFEPDADDLMQRVGWPRS